MLNSHELMEKAKYYRDGYSPDGKVYPADFAEVCEQVSKLTSLCAELVDFANERIRQSNEKDYQKGMQGILSMLQDPELMLSFKASLDKEQESDNS